MSEWRWRARLETESGRVLGAGFLVDDSRVVTCAYVVDGLERARVTFPGVADGLPASVDSRTGWSQPGDEGDVAVLRLDSPVCVRPPSLVRSAGFESRPATGSSCCSPST